MVHLYIAFSRNQVHYKNLQLRGKAYQFLQLLVSDQIYYFYMPLHYLQQFLPLDWL